MRVGDIGQLEGPEARDSGVTCRLRSLISTQFAYMPTDTKGNTSGT